MSEQRLIDANALGKRMAQRIKELEAKNGPYDHYTNGFDDAITYVEDTPTIDAVPVVRCRDCKDYERDCGYCDYWEVGRNFDDYCSRGAKMDGGVADG